MTRRLISIVGGIILLLILAFIMATTYDNHLLEQEDLRLPNRISSYPDIGYYKIDPETILASLESGNTNVFIQPRLTNMQALEEIPGIFINWTEADFLKIASTLGQFVWGDPMDLGDWNVYSVTFNGFCDNSTGLDYANIAYFKSGGRGYITRVIEIHPYFGWIGWGDGASYRRSILHKWKSVDLFGAKITGDDALRIASDDARERFHLEDKCGVVMRVPENKNPNYWYVHIFGGDWTVYTVNLKTGDYTFQKQK